MTTTNYEFEIAPGVKNTDWIQLALTPASFQRSWKTAVRIFEKRIGRFLKPLDAIMGSRSINVFIYSGFAVMALDCLLIETLQSFMKYRPNPARGIKPPQKSDTTKEAFRIFLTNRTSFSKYFDEQKADIFSDHFRNGILHQGEVKSSGLIRIDTPKMVMPSPDNQSLIINRILFHQALLDEIEKYKNELMDKKEIQKRKDFIAKMNEICRV